MLPVTDMQRRVVCSLFIGLVAPCILFTFPLLFGSGSYQLWWDRFLYELTNRYLFTRSPSVAILGPLWRDDILSGNIWAVNMGPSPLAFAVVLGRLFQLSPFTIDLVGNLTLYFTAVASMYVFLRRILGVSREGATTSAALFAVTAYWIAITWGNPEVYMGTACVPALLVMAHRIERASLTRQGIGLVVPVAGLALVFYVFALHININELLVVLLLVISYAWFVFRSSRSVLWIVIATGLGLVLYAPFLWPFIEAAGVSRRYVGTAFYAQSSFDLQRVFTEATNVLSRIAVGYNDYGIYFVTVIGVLVWICLGPRWSSEPTELRRVLLITVASSVLGYAVELFHEDLNHAKQSIPLLGGWNVWRVRFFSAFGLLTSLAWMLDRALFYPNAGPASPRRRAVLRVALIVMALLGGLRIGYSAYRMRLIPASIYPQNLVLNLYLLLFALATLSLLVFLYRRAGQLHLGVSICRTDSDRLWCVALMVLSASLVTSVHAYRSGVLPINARAAFHPLPMMTYQERYTVPDDLMMVKRLNVTDERVLDLTRPWYDPVVGGMGEAPLLALSGLKVPTGYNALYPALYYRFIHTGINGNAGALEKDIVYGKTMLQIEDTPNTSYDALGLLDVRYILAADGKQFPGYVPVMGFESSGKTLYAVQEAGRVGPAFVSPYVRCFGSDAEALDHIHRTKLPELQGQAVLMTGDAGVAPLCAGRPRDNSLASPTPPQVQVHRGIDRVRIEVESSGGVLTLADTYYPGWKVFVNGVGKPLLRTYTALRGVVVDPGPQSVEFIYSPRVFQVLLRLSNGVLVFLLLAAFVVWGQERFRERSEE